MLKTFLFCLLIFFIIVSSVGHSHCGSEKGDGQLELTRGTGETYEIE